MYRENCIPILAVFNGVQYVGVKYKVPKGVNFVRTQILTFCFENN